MKSKYKNIKTKINGIEFDSRREANRYTVLAMMEKAGIISNLRRQVRFELLPTQYETYERYSKNGKRLADGKRAVERSVSYIADFVYEDRGKTVVEDVKGIQTKEYILKRKLMLEKFGIRIKEVR